MQTTKPVNQDSSFVKLLENLMPGLQGTSGDTHNLYLCKKSVQNLDSQDNFTCASGRKGS
jgi:hypothetical protein